MLPLSASESSVGGSPEISALTRSTARAIVPLVSGSGILGSSTGKMLAVAFTFLPALLMPAPGPAFRFLDAETCLGTNASAALTGSSFPFSS